MNFREKLQRCAASENKARAGASVGLKPTTISSYLAKNSIPRADIALKIARALKVPFEWLIDDAQGWPPPSAGNPQSAIADVPNSDLVAELGRRYRLELLEAFKLLEDAETWDWPAISRSLKHSDDKKIPEMVQLKLRKIRDLLNFLMTVLLRYDVKIIADFLHDRLPGKERKLEEFNFGKLTQRVTELQQRDGAGAAFQWIYGPEAASLFAGTRPLEIDWILKLTQDRERLAALVDTSHKKPAAKTTLESASIAKRTRTIGRSSDDQE